MTHWNFIRKSRQEIKEKFPLFSSIDAKGPENSTKIIKIAIKRCLCEVCCNFILFLAFCYFYFYRHRWFVFSRARQPRSHGKWAWKEKVREEEKLFPSFMIFHLNSQFHFHFCEDFWPQKQRTASGIMARQWQQPKGTFSLSFDILFY